MMNLVTYVCVDRNTGQDITKQYIVKHESEAFMNFLDERAEEDWKVIKIDVIELTDEEAKEILIAEDDWKPHQKEKVYSTEKGVYVIYWDSQDDCCEIKGYVSTEEEADKYCEEYNAKCKYLWQHIEYMLIEDLSRKDDEQ